MKGISVIICCYNSSKRLPETIKHLAFQNVTPTIPWEIIIVNNNSFDDTTNVAYNEWNKYLINIPFNVVDQPVAGLSFARERGIKASRYEFLLFCDDDNWLCDSYVENSFKILQENSEVALLGGYGEYICEDSPPVWFNELSGPYAVGAQLNESGITPANITLYGAGAVIRKTAYLNLEKEGFKFFLSGRQGKKLLTGEDRELGYAFTLNKKKTYYDSRLKFKHFIPKERHTVDYYKTMMFNYVPASIILHCYYLNIYNTLNQRSSFKNSFLWILLMMLIQNLRHYFSIIIPYIKKGYWQFILIETQILLKYFSFWIMNRKQFITTYQYIKNAQYNKL